MRGALAAAAAAAIWASDAQHVAQQAGEGAAGVRSEPEAVGGLHLGQDLDEVLGGGRAAGGLLGRGPHEAAAVPREARAAVEGAPRSPSVLAHHRAAARAARDRRGHRVQGCGARERGRAQTPSRRVIAHPPRRGRPVPRAQQQQQQQRDEKRPAHPSPTSLCCLCPAAGLSWFGVREQAHELSPPIRTFTRRFILLLVPGTMQRGRGGALGASGDEAACPQTLKEQEREAERVVNENLNLKMRVKHLEDLLGDRGDGEESMNIWDMRSALSRERERIVEEAAREVSERDELLVRSRRTLEELRAENARLVLQTDSLRSELGDRALALETAQRAEEELARQLEAKDEELRRAQRRAEEVQREGQEVAAQLRADIEALRAELQREEDGSADLGHRLRQAEEELVAREQEVRASEANLREWAQQQIRDAHEALEAERERERDRGSEQVQLARQKERESAEKEMQLLRDDMEALSDELVRERHERQECRRRAESELATSARALQQLEASLEEEGRRLGAAGREAQEARVRALNAEQSLRKLEADFSELKHERQLAGRAAEDARKEAQDARRKLEDVQRVERERERTLAELQEAARLRDSSDSRTISSLQKQLADLKQSHAAALSAAMASANTDSKDKGEHADAETVSKLQRIPASLP